MGTRLLDLDEQNEAEVLDADNIREEDFDEGGKREDANDEMNMAFSSMMKTPESAYMSLQNKQLSFEVDYEAFRLRFWHKFTAKTKLEPLVVWTEIYSTIKGGSESLRYPEHYIPLEVYAQYQGSHRKKPKGAEFLTYSEKCEIYYIFL